MGRPQRTARGIDNFHRRARFGQQRACQVAGENPRVAGGDARRPFRLTRTSCIKREPPDARCGPRWRGAWRQPHPWTGR